MHREAASIKHPCNEYGRENLVLLFLQYLHDEVERVNTCIDPEKMKILTTLSIRNTIKPDRKNSGTIVSSSIIPSKEKMNLTTAFPRVSSGYR